MTLQTYRVWADGTTQEVGDADPYSWLSDDYQIIDAFDEDHAVKIFNIVNAKASQVDKNGVIAK